MGGIYLKILLNYNKWEVFYFNFYGCFVILLECVNVGLLIWV